MENKEVYLKQLEEMREKGDISGIVSNKILKKMVEDDFQTSPYEIQKKFGLVTLADQDYTKQYVKEALQEEQVINAIIQSVMKKSKGKSNPETIKRILNNMK